MKIKELKAISSYFLSTLPSCTKNFVVMVKNERRLYLMV